MDLFYRIVQRSRGQNTIPVIKRSLLLMALDSQRSRGAQHGGVPISPVLQRSPLPNDPFYRLRNDPRQNTIPVLNGSLMSMDRDFPTIPGGPPRRSPYQHRFFNDPRSPTILFYRLRNDPRQNTIPVHQWIPFVDGPGFSNDPGGPTTAEVRRSRGAQHRGVPTTPVLERSPLPNDPFLPIA